MGAVGARAPGAVMLVIGLGLGLAIGWPWDCGLVLRGLALAKNSRPKS